MFNPFLDSFSSTSRPVSQKISHIILSNCQNQNINLQLDLENLPTDVTRLTDISFENINRLSVELRLDLAIYFMVRKNMECTIVLFIED